MDLLIGADPEVFVSRMDRIISGHGLIPGSKEDPHEVGPGMAVQVDGMALEFNIPPAADKAAFSRDIDALLGHLQAMIGEGHHLVKDRSVVFEDAYMKSQPVKARELGCEPDWNAYSLEHNSMEGANPNLRTVGGHVHLGWAPGDLDPQSFDMVKGCAELAIQLDCSIGLQSVIHDDDTRRRSLYGKAGAFRTKTYGMEYRTLSNYWIFEDKYRDLVFETVQDSFNDFYEGARYADMLYDYGITKEDIETVINESDVDTSKNILAQLQIGW